MKKPYPWAELKEFQVNDAPFRVRFITEYRGKQKDGSTLTRLIVLLEINNRKTKRKGWLEYWVDYHSFSNRLIPSTRTMAKCFREQLHIALMHEADECFEVEGKAIFNPHKKQKRSKRKAR